MKAGRIQNLDRKAWRWKLAEETCHYNNNAGPFGPDEEGSTFNYVSACIKLQGIMAVPYLERSVADLLPRSPGSVPRSI